MTQNKENDNFQIEIKHDETKQGTQLFNNSAICNSCVWSMQQNKPFF